jgi:protein TonB
VVAAKPSSAAPDGVTRIARPQGGYQVRPAYPSAPRQLGIQGTTMLRVHVLPDGRIGDVRVEHSAGHPDLDQAAMEAVRRWRFEPARRGADAVAMWVLLPVEFRLTQ